MKKIVLLCLLWGVSSYGENPIHYKGGLEFQKEHNGYWFNGIELGVSHQKVWGHRVHLQLSYLSSQLGSSMSGNGVAEDKINTEVGLYFNPYPYFSPYFNLVLGYYRIDTEGFDVYGSDKEPSTIGYGFNFGTIIPLSERWGGPNFEVGFFLSERNGVAFPLSLNLGWTFNLFPGVFK